MLYARPATAGADVFARLQLFMNTEPTAFDLKRLEADARALERADQSEAFTVRAAIAALKWDASDARHWSEKACLANGSPKTRANASVTFRYLNRLDVAAEYAYQAVNGAPLERSFVEHLIGVLASSGRLAEAEAVAEEYFARVPTAAPIEMIDPAEFTALLHRMAVPQAQLQREMTAAMDVLTEERTRYLGIEYERAVEPDGGELMIVRIHFAGDLAKEMRLESKLAHRLADMAEWNPSKLSVEFEYSTVEQDAREPA